MTLFLLLLAGTLLGGLVGLCAGWLARGREASSDVASQAGPSSAIHSAAEPERRRDLAQEVLHELQRLTFGVSVKIDAHSKTVVNINQELEAAGEPEDGAVLSAIRRLIASNATMQSQLQLAQEQLDHQACQLETHYREARTDPVTRLRNRRAFDDEIAKRVEESGSSGEPLSIMLLDIDSFKHFNDSFGHLAGDEALRMVGRVLGESVFEQPGLFAARFGGEEFAVLFSAKSPAEAAKSGEQIRLRIGHTLVQFQNNPLAVTASAGISHFRGEESLTPFIARADEALYLAKTSGRNCAFAHNGESLEKLSASLPDAPAVKPNVTLESPLDFHRSLDRRIAEWRRGGARLALIVARLDNDVESEAKAKDRSLLMAGEYLKRSLREMDQVALIGGDMLAMLVPAARVVEAAQAAERIRANIRHGDLDQMLRRQVSMSFGVAEIVSSDDSESFVLRARRAMESARRRGGNAVYVNDGVLSKPAQEMVEMETDQPVASAS